MIESRVRRSLKEFGKKGLIRLGFYKTDGRSFAEKEINGRFFRKGRLAIFTRILDF